MTINRPDASVTIPGPVERLVENGRAHRGLLVVLAIALVVRLLLLAASSSMPLNVPDERQYAQLATSLVRGDGFAWAPGRPTSMRPPLYPAFVAAIWWIAGTESPQVVRSVQVVLSLVLILTVYVLARRLFSSSRIAMLAAAVVAFYPTFLFSGLLLLTELLFTLLLVLFALLYLRLVERPGIGIGFGVGAMLALAALTRSVLWPFPIVLVPLLLISLRMPPARRLAVTACCLAGYAAIIAPWAVRNTGLQKTLTIVDTMGGMNLRMGNYEYTPEDRMWDAVSIQDDRNWAWNLSVHVPEAATWTDGQKEKWAQRQAFEYMMMNPATTLRRSLLKFADFWGLERDLVAAFQYGLYQPPLWVRLLSAVSVIVTFPVVALSAAVGIFRSAPSDWRMHALLLVMVAFVTAVHSVVFGHSRYHLPLIPFLAMYAAAAWGTGNVRAWLQRPAAAAAPLAAWAALLMIWVHEVLFRDAERIRALLGMLA